MKKLKTSAVSFSAYLGMLGLLGVVSAIPAAASTIDLNTGNGSSPYVITQDTLSPSEGTTVNVVSSLGGGWVNDLSSEWIAPQAAQDNATVSAEGGGSVTYQTTFTLPTTGLNPGSTLNIDLAVDDWVQISLNGGSVFYTGPSTGQWASDTVVPISTAVDNQLTGGLNTLTFLVYNNGTPPDAGGGPTGLNAQVSVNYTTQGSAAIDGVPEIDPSSGTSALALIVGAVMVIRGRRKK